jgi:tyrosine-specific transport protein
MDKNFFIAVFTLIGSIIGAGILSLPYVFYHCGFILSTLYLLILFVVMLYVYLAAGELVCKFKGNHQLVDCADKLFGKKGRKIMFLTMLISANSSLLAYLIGEGESLSVLFTGQGSLALIFTILFWISMSLLLLGGVKELKKIETYGVIGIILIIIISIIIFIPKIQVSNLIQKNNMNIFLPIGAIIFALLGYTTIPEIKFQLNSNKKLLKKAIIIGVSIPALIYFLFSLVYVGYLGNNVEEIVTISSGMGIFANLLGIFAMLTSYFAISIVMFDVYTYDFKINKKISYILTVSVPIVSYLLLYIFNMADFTSVISIGGVISGGMIGIFLVWMNYKSKKIKGNVPYSVPMNKIIAYTITIIFILAIFFQIFLN